MSAYQHADIWVECHVQYIPHTTPSARVLAFRAGEWGFVARQRPDADVIDVYSLSPYDLGTAVSEALVLKGPGRHPGIVVPEYARQQSHSGRGGGSVVTATTAGPRWTTLRESRVVAYGTLQTRWRPARSWGLARDEPHLVWVEIDEDGTYLYEPDRSHATPMTRAALARRIDQMIAEDVKALRDSREDAGT